MYEYDVVFIKGNPNSGSPQQHLQINKSIIELVKSYTYTIVESTQSSTKYIKSIPKAKIYIGFSRGSRYLNRLNKNSLKLSIGGIIGSNIHNFTNIEDRVLSGDISNESMHAHFIILEKDKLKIESLISDFLKHS